MPSVTKAYGNNTHVNVTFESRPVTQQITVAEHELIRSMAGHKVVCIKFIRDQYTLGLYEAKSIVDAIHAHPLQTY